MTDDELIDLAAMEVEMAWHATDVLRQLTGALEIPDSVYPSTLIGLTDAHAAFVVFPPCDWWR